jgi:hypothetical protein
MALNLIRIRAMTCPHRTQGACDIHAVPIKAVKTGRPLPNAAPQETLKPAEIRAPPLLAQALIRETPMCRAWKPADGSQKMKHLRHLDSEGLDGAGLLRGPGFASHGF